jgi:hypothetical protein
LEEDEAKTRIVKEETKKNTKLERERERGEREIKMEIHYVIKPCQ